MCGIAGIVSAEPLAQDDNARAIAMRDVLSYRGPDGAGLHTDTHAALAHRRLSIIDLEGGHQPLSNEDESVWIVYNGEVYNFEDLNDRYLASGHSFRTRCDTETIVHLYEEMGERCFAEQIGRASCRERV